MEVWLRKTGQIEPKPTTEAMWWGIALEDVIARRYAERTGYRLENPQRVFHHPRHDILLGSPDRLTIDRARGLEVKTASPYAAHEWGEPGTDNIPQYYLLQCVHYMAVLDINVWDVAVLIGGSDFRMYTIRRDRELEQAVMERMLAWWELRMVKGVPPDIDGSQFTSDYLRRRFRPPGKDVPLVQAPPEVIGWAGRLARARAIEEVATAEMEVCQNNLKALIGEGIGFQSDDFTVTWKPAEGRRTVDWQAAAAWLLREDPEAGEKLDILKRQFMVQGEAQRRFYFNRKGGKS